MLFPLKSGRTETRLHFKTHWTVYFEYHLCTYSWALRILHDFCVATPSLESVANDSGFKAINLRLGKPLSLKPDQINYQVLVLGAEDLATRIL